MVCRIIGSRGGGLSSALAFGRVLRPPPIRTTLFSPSIGSVAAISLPLFVFFFWGVSRTPSPSGAARLPDLAGWLDMEQTERKNNFLAEARGKYFLGPCQTRSCVSNGCSFRHLINANSLKPARRFHEFVIYLNANEPPKRGGLPFRVKTGKVGPVSSV